MPRDARRPAQCVPPGAAHSGAGKKRGETCLRSEEAISTKPRSGGVGDHALVSSDGSGATGSAWRSSRERRGAGGGSHSERRLARAR
ncbi:hypothetical protein MTO96_009165 [Rhipicephalus appendiculatus]